MDVNNFKKLMQEEEIRYGAPPERIGHNLKHTIGFIGFISHVFEVFVPRVVDVFIAMTGGDEKHHRSDSQTRDNGHNSQPSGPNLP